MTATSLSQRPKALRVVLVLALLGGAAYGALRWRSARSEPARAATYAGNVDIRDVTLSFRAGGRVEEAFKREGDAVKKGETLARLDAEPYKLALAQAKSAVDVARAQLARVKAGARFEDIRELSALVAQRQAASAQASDNFARVEELTQKGALPTQALVDARSSRDQTVAALRAAEAQLTRATNGSRAEDVMVFVAQLAQAEAAVAAASLAVADCELKSSVDGVIVTRSVEPGQQLGVGSPAYVVALSDPVWIRGFAPEADLGRVAPGTPVEVVTDTRPDKPYLGQIGYVATQAEFTPKNVETAELRTSLVYRFRVVVTEHDDGLRQGMPVTMRIRGPKVASREHP